MVGGYNFTERVRKVLMLAREEAARLHHEHVGAEHELLGLLREGEGVGAVMLQNLNAPLDDVRERLELLLTPGTGGPPGPNLPYTSRGKRVVELAMSEAREANHAYVGTEHLLLGMVRDGQGVAAQVLTSFGLTLGELRREMHRILGNAPGVPSRSEFLQAPVGRGSGGLAALPERIRAVLDEAYKVAGRAGADHLEGLHVAIGLLVHGEGIAIAAIERMGADVARLTSELEAMLPASSSTAAAQVVPFAPDFLHVLGTAADEQQQSLDSTIQTHHLLLAVLERCPDVARPFSAQGVTPTRLRIAASRIVG